MKKAQAPDFQERSFGKSVGGVLVLIAVYMAWRGRITAATVTGAIGAVLVVLALTQPRLLKWPSAVWWKFALVLGYVNARVILTLAFAIVFVPLGSLWRLIGRDPLMKRRDGFRGWTPYPERYRNRDHFNKMY